MIESTIALLTLPFVQRAIIAGCIIGIAAAFLGVFITLRNMSFYADTISHTALAGIALGALFNITPFIAAVIFCVALGIMTVYLKNRSAVALDTVIGVMFAGGVALGVAILSRLQGYRAELFTFLFGDILAVTWDDIWLATLLSVAIVIFLLYTSKRLLLSTFASDLTYVRGIAVQRLEYAFFIVTSLTIALSIKVIGIILMTGLLIIPAAIAKNLAQSFKQTVGYAMIASVIATVSGMIVSFYSDLPSGPSIILVGTIGFILSTVLKRR